MKKVLAGIWVALLIQGLGGPTAHAQRYIYVDTEYMLGQMSEYAAAQSELKVQVERWNAEADEMKQEIERLYRTMRAESPLLTESMQRERLEEIKAREERLLAWQKSSSAKRAPSSKAAGPDSSFAGQNLRGGPEICP